MLPFAVLPRPAIPASSVITLAFTCFHALQKKLKKIFCQWQNLPFSDRFCHQRQKILITVFSLFSSVFFCCFFLILMLWPPSSPGLRTGNLTHCPISGPLPPAAILRAIQQLYLWPVRSQRIAKAEDATVRVHVKVRGCAKATRTICQYFVIMYRKFSLLVLY